MGFTRPEAWRCSNDMHLILTLMGCLLLLGGCAAQPVNPADMCLEITLTGTQGGPPAINGLAGAGTLVRYGTRANDCSDVLLQFDAGRGTTERLSQLGVSPLQLDAIFLTHIHSDHTEGLAGLLQYRWHFLGGPIDVVCSADVSVGEAGHERVLSCGALLEHSADALLHAGEIQQRWQENQARNPAGPVALTRLQPVDLPLPTRPGTIVWMSGDVSVSAIATSHIPGSLAYRVDTPAGSVVIGGDAGNSLPGPPRETSTSAAVEALASGADVLVHSTLHPIFAPDAGSTFPVVAYLRQSTAADLGALAQRAGVQYLMLTHLIPSLNTASHGPYAVPGGPLQSQDFEVEARDGGFTGNIYVGTDLMTLRLP